MNKNIFHTSSLTWNKMAQNVFIKANIPLNGKIYKICMNSLVIYDNFENNFVKIY